MKASSLLALPHPALACIFQHLTELRDAVALSSCNKELWALGAPARRRHFCCAACGTAVFDPVQAFNSDTFRSSLHLDLPDGASYPVDAEHLLSGCKLSEEHYLQAFAPLFSLRVGGCKCRVSPPQRFCELMRCEP